MQEIKKQDYTELVNSISAIAKQMRDIQCRAVEAYTPVVNDLIKSNCQDTHKIELTMDYLMDIASDGKGLVLFQRLLEHLKSLDPEAAQDYQRYWNELWNDEDQ